MNENRREEFAHEWAKERRQKLVVRLVLLFAAIIGIYWYFGAGEVHLGFGDKPRFHWYSIRADFEVAGKPVSVGGVIECARKGPDLPPFNLGSGRGNPYDPSNEAFATPLETGGTLFISPPQTCGHPHASIDVDFPEGYYPLVYWLDDRERPSRMEVYFSDAYYKQPNARVVFKGFEAQRLGWGAFSWSTLFGNTQLKELYTRLPWIKKREPGTFRGYFATFVDAKALGRAPAIADNIDNEKHIEIIGPDTSSLIQENWSEALEQALLSGVFQSIPGAPRYGCRFAGARTLARCAAFGETYGMIPGEETFGASISSRTATIGMVELLPERIPSERPIIFNFEIFGGHLDGPLPELISEQYLFIAATQQFADLRSVTLSPTKIGISVYSTK